MDLMLLVVATIDLQQGADPNWTHGLAAVYLGFSIAFGPGIIRWTDERVAYRFASGPKPVKPAVPGSWERVAYEWRSWLLGRPVVETVRTISTQRTDARG